MTIEDVQTMAERSRGTVINAVKGGWLHPKKVCGKLEFDEAEVKAWIAAGPKGTQKPLETKPQPQATAKKQKGPLLPPGASFTMEEAAQRLRLGQDKTEWRDRLGTYVAAGQIEVLEGCIPAKSFWRFVQGNAGIVMYPILMTYPEGSGIEAWISDSVRADEIEAWDHAHDSDGIPFLHDGHAIPQLNDWFIGWNS